MCVFIIYFDVEGGVFVGYKNFLRLIVSYLLLKCSYRTWLNAKPGTTTTGKPPQWKAFPMPMLHFTCPWSWFYYSIMSYKDIPFELIILEFDETLFFIKGIWWDFVERNQNNYNIIKREGIKIWNLFWTYMITNAKDIENLCIKQCGPILVVSLLVNLWYKFLSITNIILRHWICNI